MKVVSVATMRDLEARAMAAGVSEVALMENAGLAAAEEALAFWRQHLARTHLRRITIVAGKGNNGGDALVAARYFATHGDLPVTVYGVAPKEQFTGASRHHAKILPATVPYRTCEFLPREALASGTLIIDGLLGTGSNGPPRAPYAGIIQQINASGLPIVALDLPSGLAADTGHAAGTAITADMTVTMGLPKRGLVSAEGLTRCGVLRCVEIGIPQDFIDQAEACGEAFFAQDAMALLRRRPHEAHKGTFGHTLVVGGSRWYTGAPMLAGAAALRAGGGLVTIAIPAAVRSLTTPSLASLIVRGVPDDDTGFLGPAALAELQPLLDKVQATVFGPGVSPEAGGMAVLEQLLRVPHPLVIDADGLRLLAQRPQLAGARTAPTVMTPHPGEMRMLLPSFGLADLHQAPRAEQAVALARKTGFYVVLKGQGSWVAAPDGRHSLNSSGTSGLATAGSGDVLAGLIGSLLGQGCSPWHALCLGTFVHGFAAELSPYGARGLVADDLLTLIGTAFRELTPFA